MLILRNIYNVKSTQESLTGVKFRGRVRKYCIDIEQNILVENSENGIEVYFAIPSSDNPKQVISYIQSIIPSAKIEIVLKNIPNPVLSKIKVNDDSRY